MNYAVSGDGDKPALLLIPGQTESWWGYEQAMPLLAEHFQAFAVDLRGQGRSTRTPGRYTLDNMGNDLVRFIDGAIGRPVDRERSLVGRRALGVALGVREAGSGPRRALRGSAALRLRGESRVRPVDPPGHRRDVRALEQVPRRPVEHRRLGRDGRRRAARAAGAGWRALSRAMAGAEPPQNLKEYDPEWGRAFWTGTRRRELRPRADAVEREGARAAHPPLPQGRRHDRTCSGALSDAAGRARPRARHARRGQPSTTSRSPRWATRMHGQDPQLFTETVVAWTGSLRDRTTTAPARP